MVKFCTVCGKEFEGKGDTCTECTKSNTNSNAQNSSANANFSSTKSLNTKWIVRLIILVFLVFLCIIIASSVVKNSQKSYNQYAKELYDTVISNNLELKQESVIIDSNGETHTGKNTQSSSSTILSTNSGEYAPSSYATVIKDKYPKAKKMSWILEYDTSGNLNCVLCAKNYNSKKVGVYGEALDANVTSLDSFLAYHSEEAANADAQLDTAYSKAKDIEEYMNATDYYPDGIDQYAVITNINNKADSELCNTITSKFGGYWIIRGIVSSKNSGLYSEYTVYWASDLETELVGDSTYNFSKKTSGGIQSQLTAYEDTGCSLISKEEWMKKYETEYLQKQNAAQEKAEREKEQKKKANAISVDTITSAYNSNELSADHSYLNSSTTVIGKVYKIEKVNNPDFASDLEPGEYLLYLMGSSSVDWVNCYFDSDTWISRLERGDEVIIKGTCIGMQSFSLHPCMKNCQVEN